MHIIKEGQLLEAGASLNRIVSMLKRTNLDFGMITSFRDSEKIGLQKKQEQNDQLLKYIRSLLNNQTAYGAYRMIGHWKECSVTLPSEDKNGKTVTIDQCELYGGHLVDTLEETWLIVNDCHNPEFFDVLRKAAREYNQDAFIARIGDNFGLFSKGGQQWNTFGEVSEDTITTGFEKLVSIQGYSQTKRERIRGGDGNKTLHHFIFEGIVIPNESNSSRMLFSAMNILYKPTSLYGEILEKLRG